MVERREDLGFPLEPRKPILIRRERLWQDFDRDVAFESRVTRAVNLPHAADSQGGPHLIGAETSAGREGHA